MVPDRKDKQPTSVERPFTAQMEFSGDIKCLSLRHFHQRKLTIWQPSKTGKENYTHPKSYRSSIGPVRSSKTSARNRGRPPQPSDIAQRRGRKDFTFLISLNIEGGFR
ncbi:hypothetical protein EVAR_97399_1 [Eumeta japonica]|uniref:Uncharacterized protein n=1 Tax=Eumeta variegata TaxID=151549 RepID=A0A4C1S8K9_EUMVA|nr:hypothetical protein EVAR_97399_1 [Eumeta japonica]